MLWPTLKALEALGGSGRVQEIVDRAIELGGYTNEQQGVWHRDGRMSEIAYRLTWARSYLGAVGALENSSRSIWSITDYGRSLTDEDMVSVPARVRAMRPRKRAEAADIAASLSEIADQPVEIADNADSAPWEVRLLNTIQSMPAGAFERLCQRLLRDEGFTTVKVTGRSGDGGIDGVGVLRISLVSFQVLFQCKRYKGSVGAPAVRDLRGAMSGRTDKGLLITTGTFTQDARREATRDGALPIELIDGEQLCRLLKERRLGVETRQVEEVRIDEAWFAAI
jgi:restriction system protein